jgi:coenzyme F420-reducing hydrogenase beta subunit
MEIAFVGTPCQIQGLRKMNLLSERKDESLLIGLFCQENWCYPSFQAMIEERVGTDLKDIEKFDVRNGSLVVTYDSSETSIPMKEAGRYSARACQVCTDFAAELADISFGAAGSPYGWSTVIVRSKKALDIINTAEEEGVLETKPVSGIDDIKKIAGKKRERALAEVSRRKSYGSQQHHIEHEITIEVVKKRATGKKYQDLRSDVIENWLCTSCGTCELVCTKGYLKMEDGVPTAECEEDCNDCYLNCPRTAMPARTVEKSLDGEYENGIGRYLEVLAVRRVKKEYETQDGGAVTALLEYLLKGGVVAGVVAVKKGENWEPEPAVLSSEDEVAGCGGSVYSIATTIPAMRGFYQKEAD